MSGMANNTCAASTRNAAQGWRCSCSSPISREQYRIVQVSSRHLVIVVAAVNGTAIQRPTLHPGRENEVGLGVRGMKQAPICALIVSSFRT